MQLFNCTDLAGTAYLTEQLDEECWSSSSDHSFYAVFVGIPMVIVYAIGIPLGGAWFLYRHSAKINSSDASADEFHQKFSFLYRGYKIDDTSKPCAYLWEAIVSARKLALMFVAVVFMFNEPVQILLGLLVVAIAFAAHVSEMPFESAKLNKAETLSLGSSFLSFFLGSFTHLEVPKHISEESKDLVSYLAMLTNLGFFAVMCYWIYKSFREGRLRQVHALPKLSPRMVDTTLSTAGKTPVDTMIIHNIHDIDDDEKFDIEPSPSDSKHTMYALSGVLKVKTKLKTSSKSKRKKKQKKKKAKSVEKQKQRSYMMHEQLTAAEQQDEVILVYEDSPDEHTEM
jgi:hypothetical protein